MSAGPYAWQDNGDGAARGMVQAGYALGAKAGRYSPGPALVGVTIAGHFGVAMDSCALSMSPAGARALARTLLDGANEAERLERER